MSVLLRRHDGSSTETPAARLNFPHSDDEIGPKKVDRQHISCETQGVDMVIFKAVKASPTHILLVELVKHSQDPRFPPVPSLANTIDRLIKLVIDFIGR